MNVSWTLRSNLTIAHMLVRALLSSAPSVETLHVSYIFDRNPLTSRLDLNAVDNLFVNNWVIDSFKHTFGPSSLSSRLTYLKLTGPMPLSLHKVALLSNLHTLDISVNLNYGNDETHLFQELANNSVKSSRLLSNV